MSFLTVLYRELATLSVEHLYYANHHCKRYDVEPFVDLILTPATECIETMRRLNVEFRMDDRNAGFVLLANVRGTNGSGDDLIRVSPSAADKLTFWITARNPDARNFDDIPIANDPTHTLYFSNAVGDGGASRDGLHLSQDVAGVDGNKDVMKLASASYTYKHTSVVPSPNVKVVHERSKRSIQPVSNVAESGRSRLTFDLSVLPIGRCMLLISGVPAEEFYYPGAYPPSPLLGVIELSLDPSVTANYRILESDRSLTKARPRYVVRFINRKTWWRYTFEWLPTYTLATQLAAIGSDTTALDAFKKGLSIQSNDPAVAFQLQSLGSSSMEFVSSTLVPLHEQYRAPKDAPLKLNLITGATVLRHDLPFPSPSAIDARDSSNIYSDVFLTL